MKLREEEFYNEYHQHGGTTIIPTEIFNELYDDATEEIERLNNIINELEKWLKEEIERLMTIEQSNNVIFLIGAYTEVLDKINELKGVDKEWEK